MSEELTPLKAFEILKEDIGKCYKDESIIVETALKDYEKMKQPFIYKDFILTEKDFEKLRNTPPVAMKVDENIERKLKVLEIIKKLIIDFSFNYGGKMGNVVKIRIGDDIIRLYFPEGDKKFEIIKEFLYA